MCLGLGFVFLLIIRSFRSVLFILFMVVFMYLRLGNRVYVLEREIIPGLWMSEGIISDIRQGGRACVHFKCIKSKGLLGKGACIKPLNLFLLKWNNTENIYWALSVSGLRGEFTLGQSWYYWNCYWTWESRRGFGHSWEQHDKFKC